MAKRLQSAPFLARYAGSCACCGDSIEPGDVVAYRLVKLGQARDVDTLKRRGAPVLAPESREVPPEAAEPEAAPVAASLGFTGPAGVRVKPVERVEDGADLLSGLARKPVQSRRLRGGDAPEAGKQYLLVGDGSRPDVARDGWKAAEVKPEAEKPEKPGGRVSLADLVAGMS